MNDEVNSFEFERDRSNFCIFGIKKSPFAIESRIKRMSSPLYMTKTA